MTVIRQLLASGAKVNQAREVRSWPLVHIEALGRDAHSPLSHPLAPHPTPAYTLWPYVLMCLVTATPSSPSRMALPPCGWQLRWVTVRWWRCCSYVVQIGMLTDKYIVHLLPLHDKHKVHTVDSVSCCSCRSVPSHIRETAGASSAAVDEVIHKNMFYKTLISVEGTMCCLYFQHCISLSNIPLLWMYRYIHNHRATVLIHTTTK